jgi:hypothetical protein
MSLQDPVATIPSVKLVSTDLLWAIGATMNGPDGSTG